MWNFDYECVKKVLKRCIVSMYMEAIEKGYIGFEFNIRSEVCLCLCLHQIWVHSLKKHRIDNITY